MPPGGCCRFTWFFFGLVWFLHVSTSADRADALVSVAHKHKEGGILQRERFVCCYTPRCTGLSSGRPGKEFQGPGREDFPPGSHLLCGLGPSPLQVGCCPPVGAPQRPHKAPGWGLGLGGVAAPLPSPLMLACSAQLSW